MALSSSGVRRYWGPRCSGPWAKVRIYGGSVLWVRPSLVEGVKALDAVLRNNRYQAYPNQTWSYNCRRIGGTNQWSAHAYGAAIDINSLWNPFGGSRHHIPRGVANAITAIRTNNGRQVWTWGGNWSGKKDWMHFQVGCTPGDLATGINWRTVSGTPVGHVPNPPKPAPIKPPEPTFPIYEDEGDDLDMRLFRDHNGIAWILTGRERHPISMNEYKALKQTWMPNHDLSKDSPFYNPIISQVILNNTVKV